MKHVRHLVGDPVIARFCGLRVLPGDRTVSRWLNGCAATVRSALLACNAELVALTVRPLKLRRLMVDADGMVMGGAAGEVLLARQGASGDAAGAGGDVMGLGRG